MVTIFAWLENDLDRNTLDDFYVVTSRVFRRQQAEDGSRSPRNAVHMTAVGAAVRVQGSLPSGRAHVPELRFFEVRGDPHLIQRNHGEHCSPGSTFNPTTTLLVTSPLTGANILVYPRLSSAWSSSALF